MAEKKFRSILAELTRDMGLTDKAIDELAELSGKGIGADTSEDEMRKVADSIVPFARAMQAEITRKAQAGRRNATTKVDNTPSEDNTTSTGGNAGQEEQQPPKWLADKLASFDAALSKLQSENDTLRAEKKASERQTAIAAGAKKRGIPDFLMKRWSLSEDADIDKELDSYKQELINHSLLPKTAGGSAAGTEAAMKADADSWAKSLPNR